MGARKSKAKQMIPEFGQRVRRRPARMADNIRELIATLILRKIKDPRLQNVTITSVDVSDDLGTARVYYGCPDTDVKDVGKGLDRAQGFIRSELAKNLTTRYVPRLIFKHDLSLAHQEKIESLLREIANEPRTPSS